MAIPIHVKHVIDRVPDRHIFVQKAAVVLEHSPHVPEELNDHHLPQPDAQQQIVGPVVVPICDPGLRHSAVARRARLQHGGGHKLPQGTVQAVLQKEGPIPALKIQQARPVVGGEDEIGVSVAVHIGQLPLRWLQVPHREPVRRILTQIRRAKLKEPDARAVRQACGNLPLVDFNRGRQILLADDEIWHAAPVEVNEVDVVDVPRGAHPA
mmetsp:Transcript_99121/g.303042  ORF Transcript_99121/g.303042 Transcript_99121/m.303042 type:complete len:210 (-) Transcript_99121:1036-1665(-)